MEWLEFSGWSDDVLEAMTTQLECQKRVPPRHTNTLVLSTIQIRARLEVLLRTHSATNPWGHPPEKF